MAKTFLSATTKFEDITTLASSEINKYVLKNNDSTLRKMYAFFQSDNNLLLVNGFAGTGKKQITEHILSYMNKETLICKYVATESTKLDDVHLHIYNVLKQKTAIKDMSEIDAITSIKDKVEYILTKINFRYILVFYNFDNISDDNKFEINNYICSLSNLDNLKSVIVSRVYDTEQLSNECKYTKIMIKALSKDLFEAYIREYGINITTSLLEQLYRLTRGYFLYACYACKIMLNQDLTINNFIIQYSNSGTNFDDFLAKTYYSLVVGTTKSSFNLMLNLRHGVNANVIENIGGYPEIVLKTLSENYYIYKKGKVFYVNNFLKQYLSEKIECDISKEKLARYYEQQIELSPDNRDLLISRATMTQELARFKNIPLEIEELKDTSTQNNANDNNTQIITKPKIEYSELSPEDILKKALESYEAYEHLETLECLSAILQKKANLSDSNILQDTYKLLSETYTRLSKWEYALYYYDILEKYYEQTTNKIELDNIKYKKTNIYYQSYQFYSAINLSKKILATVKDPQILADTNIILGNIALSTSNKEIALKHYQDGIKQIDASTKKETALELFFKFALLSDENDDFTNAVEYYQRCTDIDLKNNKYIALAHSNLGDLFYDYELKNEAKEHFEKAYECEKDNNNNYGMYYSLSKIVELTTREDKDLRIQLQEEAKKQATISKDEGTIIDATLKLGDIYADYALSEKALKEYLEIYNSSKNSFSEYNMNKLRQRIQDIKARLGEDKFGELAPNYE